MRITNIKTENIIVFLFFLIIFLIGITVYKDYGLTIDDQIYWNTGEFYYEYIKILFTVDNIGIVNDDIERLSQEITGYQIPYVAPILFELPLVALTKFFNINNSKEVYELCHLANFLIFFVSLIAFFKFVQTNQKSIIYSIIAVTMLFLSPRFFAESFYNSRDIFFLSLFIFYLHALQNFIHQQNFKTSLYLSFTSSLLIYAKIVGIIPVVLFFFIYYLNSLNKKNNNKNEIKFILFIILMSMLFIYILWPYLWLDPLNNLIHSFKWSVEMQNDISILNFYFGEYILSNNVSWHYRIVWFLITTPVIIVLFFLVGFFLLLKQIIEGFMKIKLSTDDPWKNLDEMINQYLFFILISILFITIKFDTSQFGSWRHIYFLYPIVILFSLFGIRFITSLFKDKKYKNVIFSLFILNFIYIIHWNYLNHPHQQVFFNFISKDYAKNNFDLDYWGLSNSHSIKYLLSNNVKFPIKIGSVSFSTLKVNTLILKEEDKRKIIIVSDLNDADFLLDNYMKRLRNNFVVDKNKYKKYHDIIVNGVPINTIYKKIN